MTIDHEVILHPYQHDATSPSTATATTLRSTSSLLHLHLHLPLEPKNLVMITHLSLVINRHSPVRHAHLLAVTTLGFHTRTALRLLLLPDARHPRLIGTPVLHRLLPHPPLRLLRRPQRLLRALVVLRLTVAEVVMVLLHAEDASFVVRVARVVGDGAPGEG